MTPDSGTLPWCRRSYRDPPRGIIPWSCFVLTFGGMISSLGDRYHWQLLDDSRNPIGTTEAASENRKVDPVARSSSTAMARLMRREGTTMRNARTPAEVDERERMKSQVVFRASSV